MLQTESLSLHAFDKHYVHRFNASFLAATRYEYAALGMIIGFFLSSGKICQIEHYRGQRSTGTWVIEATEFKFEVRSELR